MTTTILPAVLLLTVALACRQADGGDEDRYTRARQLMVERQLAARDITDRRVLDAMKKVPRHEFMPERVRAEAYDDHPLPIGFGQTISQPYIVAFMTQAARPDPEDRALEVGTGSGYQAAVLGELVREVYTIEIVEPLGRQAADTLEKLGYDNVHVRVGDGYEGWPEKAPFDIILITAAPRTVPKPLLEQLKEGGVLVAPVGSISQELVRYEKHEGRLVKKDLLPVRFVPMTGRAQDD